MSRESVRSALLVALAATLGLTGLVVWPTAPPTPDADFTDDGRFLLQFDRVGVHAIDPESGAVRRRLRFPSATAAVRLGWPQPGGGVSLAVASIRPGTTEPVHEALLLDPGAGTLTPLPPDTPDAVGVPAPDGSLVAWPEAFSVEQRAVLHAAGPSGRLGAPVALPLPATGTRHYRSFRFGAGGRTILGRWQPRPARMGVGAWRLSPPAPTAGIGLVLWDRRDAALRRDGPYLPYNPIGMLAHDDGTAVGMSAATGPQELVVVTPEGAVRTTPLPEGLHIGYPTALSADGRLYALVAHRLQRLPDGTQRRRPARLLVYDVPAGTLRRSWPLTPRGETLDARFAGGDVLTVGTRSGRVERFDPDGGARTHAYTARPPALTGRRAWFGHLAAAVLLLWAVAWLALHRRVRDRPTAAFATAVLWAAGWLTLRLLPEELVTHTPALWPAVPDWIAVGFPHAGLAVLCGSLALPLVAFAVAAAWWNRTRPARLFWLLAVASAVVLPAAIDADVQLAGGHTPAWLLPGR